MNAGGKQKRFKKKKKKKTCKAKIRKNVNQNASTLSKRQSENKTRLIKLILTDCDRCYRECKYCSN